MACVKLFFFLAGAQHMAACLPAVLWENLLESAAEFPIVLDSPAELVPVQEPVQVVPVQEPEQVVPAQEPELAVWELARALVELGREQRPVTQECKQVHSFWSMGPGNDIKTVISTDELVLLAFKELFLFLHLGLHHRNFTVRKWVSEWVIWVKRHISTKRLYRAENAHWKK